MGPEWVQNRAVDCNAFQWRGLSRFGNQTLSQLRSKQAIQIVDSSIAS